MDGQKTKAEQLRVGGRALMPDGYAVLARRFGASIIPTFLVMTDDGKYRFMIEDAIKPRVTNDFDADVRDCIARCIEVMERYVRQYREQWYVFRPVWDGQKVRRQDRQGRRMMRARRLGAQVAHRAGRMARRTHHDRPTEPERDT